MKQIVSALKPLFDQIGVQFDKMNERFDKMDERFDKMDGRFDKVDTELANVKGTARRTAVEVSKLRGDVTDMKLEMATKHDIGRQDSRLIAFMTEIQTSRKERILAEKSYMRHEDRLENHEKRLSRLETRRA